MCSYSFKIVFILYLPIQVLNFSLKLEGLIDLGPKWDYIYKLTPINRDQEIYLKDLNKNSKVKQEDVIISNNVGLATESDVSNTKITYDDEENLRQIKPDLRHNIKKVKKIKDKTNKVIKNTKKRKNRGESHHKTTKQIVRNTYISNDNSNYKKYKNHRSDVKNEMDDKTQDINPDNEIFNKHSIIKNHLRVKKLNDSSLKKTHKINDFILHTFKQSLKVIDKMKKMTDDVRIRRKIKLIKNGYIEKFGDFIKETEKHKLRTKLANQNIILNIIDTSNNILKRLINYISVDIKDGFNIQKKSGILKTFEREIERHKDIENKHACTKLSICRTNNEYSDFIIKVLDIILKTDNNKLKQAVYSLTETVKTNDLTNIIDSETQRKLHKSLSNIEEWDPFVIRSMFFILKAVIQHKNEPIIMTSNGNVDKTVSFHSLIDILNKNMGTVENKKQWKDMINKMEDWRDGNRKDVQSVIESIMKQMINVLEKLEYKVKNDVRDILRVLVN